MPKWAACRSKWYEGTTTIKIRQVTRIPGQNSQPTLANTKFLTTSEFRIHKTRGLSGSVVSVAVSAKGIVKIIRELEAHLAVFILGTSRPPLQFTQRRIHRVP